MTNCNECEMDTDLDASDIDSEIEVMLYSQVHYQESFSPELIQTSQEAQVSLCLPNKKSIHMGVCTVTSDAKENSGNSDNIIDISSDECEIISDNITGDSKYTWTDAARDSLKKLLKTLENGKSYHTNVQKQHAVSKVNERQQLEECRQDYSSDSDVMIISDDENAVVKPEQPNAMQNNRKRLLTDRNVQRGTGTCTESKRRLTKQDHNWFVLDKDLHEDVKNRSSLPRKRELQVVCNNCNRRGHLSKCCSRPLRFAVCYICGYEGHQGAHCPKLSCSLCWEDGHKVDVCPKRVRLPFATCKHCKSRGHKAKHCPDFWRRYHSTVRDCQPIDEKLTLKPQKSMFCCNCGEAGHYVDKCKKRRMDFCVTANRLDVQNYKALLPTPPLSHQMQNVKSRPKSVIHSVINKSKRKFTTFKGFKRNSEISVTSFNVKPQKQKKKRRIQGFNRLFDGSLPWNMKTRIMKQNQNRRSNFNSNRVGAAP